MPACVSNKIRVTFDRIGRRRDVPALELGKNQEIADAVARYALRFLSSRGVDVTVDLDAMRGALEGGRYGTFSLEIIK